MPSGLGTMSLCFIPFNILFYYYLQSVLAAPVYLAGVLDYLAAELVELASKAAHDCK